LTRFCRNDENGVFPKTGTAKAQNTGSFAIAKQTLFHSEPGDSPVRNLLSRKERGPQDDRACFAQDGCDIRHSQRHAAISKILSFRAKSEAELGSARRARNLLSSGVAMAQERRYCVPTWEDLAEGWGGPAVMKVSAKAGSSPGCRPVRNDKEFVLQ